MADKKQPTMIIEDGKAFFSHETSVNFNPAQVILDFKCITPRVDIRSKESPILSIEHNVVMMDPYHAKILANLLAETVKKFERELGKISKPSALLAHESKMKKRKSKNKKSLALDYLG